MITKSQNTSFKSRIVVSQDFFSSRSLSKLYRNVESVEAPWTLNESKFLQREGFTEGAVTCTAGLLKVKGGNEFYIFHFDTDPLDNVWHKLKPGLLEVQERLKGVKKDAVLEGFLIGANPICTDSMKQAKNLIEFFRETGVRFSALIGQKSFPYANLHYSLPKDQITISFPRCRDEKNISDLKRRFSEVVIDEGDELQFGENPKSSLIGRLCAFARGHGA